MKNLVDNTTKKICITAMGIALYVALSMTAKIPVIGHISLDLGYIVLAVFCYIYGGVIGAIVGGVGCTLVSVISSGWFPVGWLFGNILIGFSCGKFYQEDKTARNIIVTVLSVIAGVLVVKTFVECLLYNIPLVVKVPKNAVATIMDAFVMSAGSIIAPKVSNITKRENME